jgi:hypothetical protein
MDDKRRRDRKKAVLPVRVCSNDVSGNSGTELVHTLDITESGARLGGVRQELKPGSVITLQYKQHKAEFRVVWTEATPGRSEYRVGIQAVNYKDVWGLGADFRPQAKSQLVEQAAEPIKA